MLELLFSLLWLGSVAYLIWRAFRQRNAFHTLEPLLRPSSDRTRSVSIVIPARDEASNVGACLHSLLCQNGVDIRIVVVDDDSTDETAEIVAAIASEDRRVRLLHTPPLPAGWKGKVHACCTGLSAIADDEWVCFIDADVKAIHPAAIASAVDTAVGRRLDLLSLMPRQEMRSFAERLMMPCGLYILAFSQKTSKARDGKSRDVAATGQFMLFRRAAYEAVGGHASVRGEICEDIKLARRLKDNGWRVVLLDGSNLLSTRMYTGWDTLWPGIAKNLGEMLGGPVRMTVMALLALAMAWAAVALPVIDIYSCVGGSGWACIALAPALLGTAAALAFHIAGAIHFGIPVWYGFLFPFGYTAGAMIGFDGLRWRLTRRVRWKGRVYP
jgi:chlorobactene glucosyltransferase